MFDMSLALSEMLLAEAVTDVMRVNICLKKFQIKIIEFYSLNRECFRVLHIVKIDSRT